MGLNIWLHLNLKQETMGVKKLVLLGLCLFCTMLFTSSKLPRITFEAYPRYGLEKTYAGNCVEKKNTDSLMFKVV